MIAAVDVAGLAYTEAADVLQIPVGTVMSRLHRGRARLQSNYAARRRSPLATPRPRRTRAGTRSASCA